MTEHAGALNAQAVLIAEQNQQALIRDVGKIAQRIAGDTAAAERQKTFVWAAGSLTVLSMLMFGVGMAIGSQNGMGWGFLAALTLGIGFIGGLVSFQLLSAGGQVSNSVNDEQLTEKNTWTDAKVRQYFSTNSIYIPDSILNSVICVLVNGESINSVANRTHDTAGFIDGYIRKMRL